MQVKRLWLYNFLNHIAALPITKHTIPTTMTEMTNIQTLTLNLLDIVNIQKMTKYMNAKKDLLKISLPVQLNFVSANDKITSVG
ncbi:MAG TPA: hypothetical protein VHJ38_15625 [Nitrososphaeraceae archaeon]|nr:hypothetical protein [Nitrososphaeraceae archaeon]